MICHFISKCSIELLMYTAMLLRNRVALYVGLDKEGLCRSSFSRKRAFNLAGPVHHLGNRRRVSVRRQQRRNERFRSEPQISLVMVWVKQMSVSRSCRAMVSSNLIVHGDCFVLGKKQAAIAGESLQRNWFRTSKLTRKFSGVGVRASMVDSFESSSNFAERMEKAWLISQQPRPIACSTCNSNGHVECQWCRGTGFFILGDNMLCQVPSRDSSCVICVGKGSTCCTDCKGTGFRAKWLGHPQISK